jgi:hypothetical protein
VLPLEDVERNLIVTSFVDAWLALKHVFGAKFLRYPGLLSCSLHSVSQQFLLQWCCKQ